MKRMITFAVCALTCMTASLQAAQVGDEINCELRYYGSVEEGGLPIPGPFRADRAALFSSDAQLGSIRYGYNDEVLPGPASRDGKLQLTYGYSVMNVGLGETKLSTSLGVFYTHAVQLDEAGKPVKAVQKACLTTTLTKNHMYVIGYNSKGCGIVEGDHLPGPYTIRGDEDPFDPANGWTPVKIENGVAELDLNEEKFIETPSGAGVLKVACSTERQPIFVPIIKP